MKGETDLALIEAARWRMRLAGSPQERGDEFRAWLMADARNGEAWSQVQTAWDAMDARATSPKLVQWRQDALAYVGRAAVSSGTAGRVRRPWAIALGVAASLVLAAGAALWSSYRFDDYRTTPGERRVVTLADGSEVALDSDSEVKVRFGRHARELILVAGQARFNVAHDMLRPFSVQAQHHEVVATGTSFNVDLTGADLVVTLIEGRVVVLPPPASRESESTLDAGEQLVLSPVAPPRIVRVNVDHAIAWESGSLIFDNEPLSKVIRRVSRYGGPPISLADAPTANLRISGVFREGDIRGFLDTVASYLALSAEQQPDGSIRLRRGAAEDAPDPHP
jgi:transmembrane sensor